MQNMFEDKRVVMAAAVGGAVFAAGIGFYYGRTRAPGMMAGGSKFAKVNKDTSGPQYEQDLPVGKNGLQLYSLATPNGQKVTLLLEELGVAYDAHFISIFDGSQFGSGFTKGNPNSKIPLLVDRQPLFQKTPVDVFESCNILQYLADKHSSALYPKDAAKRTECNNWLFFQHGGVGPYFGQFGHFYRYAPCKIPYAIDRYTTEMRRILHVLDTQLAKHEFLCSFGFSIADIATYPWVKCIETFYEASNHVRLPEYKNVAAWMARCEARPATKIGMKVNGSEEEFKNYSSPGRSSAIA